MSSLPLRRLAQVHGSLAPRVRFLYTPAPLDSVDGGEVSVLSIGDVSVQVQSSHAPHKVPVGPRVDVRDQRMLHHLQWMLKKDLLGQDMFLLGPPGPLKRNLAMTYCGLTNRPVEYISLHRDTSGEADIKQRREIRKVPHERIEWIDAPAVRAAIEGSVLVIDGIEKAERNVLPVLNNLLENREMTLEDGRHLVHPLKYQSLLQTHSEADLKRWKLVKTSDRFRVVALGAPAPPFKGYPLDPPFRSRFQVRYLDGHDETLAMRLSAQANSWPDLSSSEQQALRLMVETVQYGNRDESLGLNMPRFPQTAMAEAQRILQVFPYEQPNQLLAKAYPHHELGLLTKDQLGSLEDLWKRFAPKSGALSSQPKPKTPTIRISARDEGTCTVSLKAAESISVTATCGKGRLLDNVAVHAGGSSGATLLTPRFHRALHKMVQAHVIGRDIAVVGPRSSGKSELVRYFTRLFGYHFIPVYCYREMTARDLLQRRATNDLGETVWEDAPLVNAAVTGHCCVLEGIDVLPAGVLESLSRLMCDREMTLPDGSVLMHPELAKELMQRQQLTQEDLVKQGIRVMHPSFRVVITATLAPQPSSSAASTTLPPWFSEELATMCQMVHLNEANVNEERAIIAAAAQCPAESLDNIVAFARDLRSEERTSGVMTKTATFSTRQLIRIAKRIAHHNDEDLYRDIHRMCLSSFMPSVARNTLDSLLARHSILPVPAAQHSINITPSLDGQQPLVIGDERYSIKPVSASAQPLVPSIPDFAPNPLHNKLLRDMLVDFKLGDHLLLIGNQGVGKNKLADKFLELLHRPREYIQLHRDSTILSLMVQPTVENGVIVHKDSPLVEAVKKGHILVVDEADKAPVHVISVLKSLAETGEMTLSNGTFIRPASANQQDDEGTSDVLVHPDFRLIVLANRPGFPFLGNEFFSAIGDVFSCHPIDNLDYQSELTVVSKVAPDVSQSMLGSLVASFQELRQAFDNGLVSYPFSLRELLHIARHMQRYPSDQVDTVLRNVFDFDLHSGNSKELSEVIVPVLQKHGLPVSETYTLAKVAGGELDVDVKKRLELKMEKRPTALDLDKPKHGKEDPKNEPHVGGNTWAGGTGGRDTAGLGGVGGPYRLDKGHDVHQVSDEIKDQVPEEVKQAAREMGQEGLRKRLAEIHMSEYDAKNYEKFRSAVSHNIRQLRFLLNSLESKQPERVWLRNQTDGELDETKLIESLTGESGVYKKRGLEPQVAGGWRQPKPKRLKFVFDVSASMYRFNGLDGRLMRSLETAVMIMESLAGLDEKFVYDISGHSGDSSSIPFVEARKPPKNERERLRVLEQMVAHAQYCWSGDTTLEACQRAVKELAAEQKQDAADEYHVVVLSDANLRRYGISGKEVARVLSSGDGDGVHASMIFIGTLGEEAQRLQTSLPPGRGFVVKEGKDVPNVMRQLFAASITA
ncbi:hypothetical protein RI367_007978 [Sorochytrium milnesiophthora]